MQNDKETQSTARKRSAPFVTKNACVACRKKRARVSQKPFLPHSGDSREHQGSDHVTLCFEWKELVLRCSSRLADVFPVRRQSSMYQMPDT